MTTALELRLATHADADAVSALIRPFSPVPAGTSGWEPFFHSISAQGIGERLALPDQCFIVATVDSAIVGVIAMRDFLRVGFFFVHEGSQGLGIGRALWRHMRQLAIGNGQPGPTWSTPIRALSRSMSVLVSASAVLLPGRSASIASPCNTRRGRD